MIALPEIGLATHSDAEAIASLSRTEVEQGLRWTWKAHRVRQSIQHRDTNVVVARWGPNVTGFALMKYGPDRAHLLLLAVAPSQRRQGIATALLAWLENTLLIAGIHVVQVEVRASNLIGLSFYSKLGFEQVNVTPKYYQGVESAVHLVKELGTGAT